MPQSSVLKRGQVQTFLVKMIFYYHANKTHFFKKSENNKKSFALGLVLRVSVFGTRERPITAAYL